MQVRRISGDVVAESLGYIESDTRSQLSDGRRIHVDGIPPRIYVGKDILEIDLSAATDEVRRSIAVLLSELFITVFPYGSPFLAVVTEDDLRSVGDLLPQFTIDDLPDLEYGSPRSRIYVFEDSMIDLGLTSAVERNWERLFEIVTDYLAWNLEEVAEPEAEPAPTEAPDPTSLFPDRPAAPETRRAGFLARILERFTSRFSRGTRNTAASAQEPGPAADWTESSTTDQAMQTREATDEAPQDFAQFSGAAAEEATEPQVQDSSSSADHVSGDSIDSPSASHADSEADDSLPSDQFTGGDGLEPQGGPDATQ